MFGWGTARNGPGVSDGHAEWMYGRVNNFNLGLATSPLAEILMAPRIYNVVKNNYSPVD